MSRARVIGAGVIGLTPVLHHHGHGGAGVTLSWGAAADAAALARDLLRG